MNASAFSCPVCFEVYKNPTTLPCGHCFCLECVDAFFFRQEKRRCPICRAGVPAHVHFGKNLEMERMLHLISTMTLRELMIPAHELVVSDEVGVIHSSCSHVVRGKWLGLPVYVKRMVTARGAAADLISELALLSKLRHPHIVTIYGACDDGPQLSIVLEVLGGGTLYDALHSRSTDATTSQPQPPQSPPQQHVSPRGLSALRALRYAQHVCLAMCFLHSRHVLHHSLTSSNVMLSADGSVCKLGEFGLSCSVLEGRAMRGTAPPSLSAVAYHAPDEASSMGTDVYAFGVLLNEMLTGELPWSGVDPNLVVERVRAGDRPHMAPHTPVVLRNLIAACWSPNVNSRPSFQQILAQLRSIEASGTSLASPVPTTTTATATPTTGTTPTTGESEQAKDVAEAKAAAVRVDMGRLHALLRDATVAGDVLADVLTHVVASDHHATAAALADTTTTTTTTTTTSAVDAPRAGGGASSSPPAHAATAAQEMAARVLARLRAPLDAATPLLLRFLALLCRGVANKHMLAEMGGIPVVLHVMRAHAQQADVQMHAISLLWDLAKENAANKTAITEAGAIVLVLDAMRAHATHVGVQKRACGCLCNLSSFSNKSKSTLLAHGGIPLVVAAMRNHPTQPKLLRYASACMRNLSNNEECKDCIGQEGGLQELLKAMKNHPNDANVLEYACSALCNLAYGVNENKEIIVEGGGVGMVLEAFRAHVNTKVREYALAVLRNICSSDSTRIAVDHNMIPHILRAMSSSHSSVEIREQCCGLLRNILKSKTCSDVDREAIVNRGGIEALLMSMRTHMSSTDVQQQAIGCCAALAKVPGNQALLTHGDDVVTLILASMRMHPACAKVQGRSLTALRHLCRAGSNKACFAQEMGVRTVITAAREHLDDKKICKRACAVLWAVCQNSDNNKQQVVREGGLPLLVHVLTTFADNEGVHRACVGCLRCLCKSNRHILGQLEALPVPDDVRATLA